MEKLSPKWSTKKDSLLASLLEEAIKSEGIMGWKAASIAECFLREHPKFKQKNVEKRVMKFWFNRSSFMAHKYGNPNRHDPGMCPKCFYDSENTHLTKSCFWANS